MIAAACAAYYFTHKKEVDYKFRKLKYKIEKKTDDAIEAGKKSIDLESKYKRDREDMVR